MKIYLIAQRDKRSKREFSIIKAIDGCFFHRRRSWLETRTSALLTTNGADENAINADDDLMRQWMAQHQTVSEDQPTNSPADRKPVEKMGINELRAECKSRGIKLSRRDNMKSLKDKLLGQNTA